MCNHHSVTRSVSLVELLSRCDTVVNYIHLILFLESWTSCDLVIFWSSHTSVDVSELNMLRDSVAYLTRFVRRENEVNSIARVVHWCFQTFDHIDSYFTNLIVKSWLDVIRSWRDLLTHSITQNSSLNVEQTIFYHWHMFLSEYFSFSSFYAQS